MRVIKKINTSAVLCKDDNDRQLVALGRGIGFTDIGNEVDLDHVDRTFYDVDARYLDVIGDLPSDILEFASQFADIASGMFSYELSPNIAFILADHIAFAIKRAREHIDVKMPLAFDVAQQFPLEYRLGTLIVDRIGTTLGTVLPADEAAGMAMVFINNISMPGASATAEVDWDFVRFLEQATRGIEGIMGVSIDRQGFNFARYATHLRYLYRRIRANEAITSGNASMYESLKGDYPDIVRCVDHLDNLIMRELGRSLTDEEKLYLLLHVNRIITKTAGDG